MGEQSIISLLVLALATWRVSSLVSTERGPYAMFEKYRQWMGIYYTPDGTLIEPRTESGRLLACPWCNSVWFGTLASILYYTFGEPIVWIAMPLALSAAAIIVGKVVEPG